MRTVECEACGQKIELTTELMAKAACDIQTRFGCPNCTAVQPDIAGRMDSTLRKGEFQAGEYGTWHWVHSARCVKTEKPNAKTIQIN